MPEIVCLAELKIIASETSMREAEEMGGSPLCLSELFSAFLNPTFSPKSHFLEVGGERFGAGIQSYRGGGMFLYISGEYGIMGGAR